MTRLLLCGVYKPYGVQDDTGEALCTMELLNNQVTREQGIHSPRSSNPSFGLYLLAENLNVPVTVLDFPTWEEFTREIDTGGYSHVGISFIVPNVLKARRMAEYIRKAAPRAKIILGGHGTAIPGIRELVDCDEVCHGEGVAWLRHYFGEETDRPIVHPVVESAVNGYVYGAPLLGKAGILIPGVGCQNSCRFCSTSHKFDRKYTPFLATGEEMFEACRKAEQELGVDDFGVIDENFCKEPARARELLAEMERNGKAYSFSIFSSAETLAVLGIDFLLRLGVNFIWIGVESKANLFEKTRGVDLHRLVAELQDHGISVLASSILFLEHHDKKTIHEDIVVGPQPGIGLLPVHGTRPHPGDAAVPGLRGGGQTAGGHPWPKKHGQDEIWFHHPEFTLPNRLLPQGRLRPQVREQGPGVLAMAHTAVKGYLALRAEIEDREKKGLAWDPETMRYVQGQAPAPDPFMRLRLERVKKTALMFRPALGAMMRYAPNARAEAKCRKVMAMYREAFGPMSLTDRLKAMAVRVFALRESRRIRKEGVVMRQPPTRRVTYPERKAVARCPVQREAMIA